ncbi:MAG: twin-arginine translocase subunit TatC [Chloroflexi bacterium]|nr:twin-arginine translocase subunit TatC [Chloroflexota bacterium]
MKDEQDGNSLTVGSHLDELRSRVTKAVLAVVLTTAVAFLFHEQILLVLMQPAEGFAEIPNSKPVYTQLTEFIGIAFKVSLLAGLFLSLPFVLFQIVMFVAPGLTPKERRYLYGLLPATIIAFAAGAIFGHQVLFPPAVRFLLNFGSDIATPFISIGSYINLMLTLLLWMGLVFETPIVAFFLSRIGVVTGDWLAKQRKYAVIVAFILGAIITPTFDPINQTIVSVPIIVMYELGIWLAKLGGRGRKKAAQELSGADTKG